MKKRIIEILVVAVFTALAVWYSQSVTGASPLQCLDSSSGNPVYAYCDSSGYMIVSGTVTANASGTQTVTATDLDIRNLTAASDTVTVIAPMRDTFASAYATASASATGTFSCPGAISGGCTSVTIVNESAADSSRICVNAACSGATSGIRLSAGATYIIDEAEITSIGFYAITSTQTISILWGGR
jgi:hypothetical protein